MKLILSVLSYVCDVSVCVCIKFECMYSLSILGCLCLCKCVAVCACGCLWFIHVRCLRWLYLCEHNAGEFIPVFCLSLALVCFCLEKQSGNITLITVCICLSLCVCLLKQEGTVALMRHIVTVAFYDSQ